MRNTVLTLSIASAFVLAACSRGPGAPTPSAGSRAGSRTAREAPVARRAPPSRPRPRYLGALDSSVTEADLDSLWAHQLLVPVEGVLRRSLRDDFNAPRAGRPHRAMDIMSPKGTVVLAPDDLVVGRLFEGPIGGRVIYATDPSGAYVYYFAHLDRYRRGLAVGDRVAKGSLIGYVGTTGNASPNAPHLHFQVMKRGGGGAWWDGPPINPLYLLASDGVRP